MTQKTKKGFDYRSIKTFEDACERTGMKSNELPDVTNISEEFQKCILAGYKLMIIFKAINNGWKPDWGKPNQWKYYPWFSVLSSGFGFSGSHCSFDSAFADVGSRLCTDTSEKALYIASQFESLYKDYFLYSE
jgi:hypothetical protein